MSHEALESLNDHEDIVAIACEEVPDGTRQNSVARALHLPIRGDFALCCEHLTTSGYEFTSLDDEAISNLGKLLYKHHIAQDFDDFRAFDRARLRGEVIEYLVVTDTYSLDVRYLSSDGVSVQGTAGAQRFATLAAALTALVANGARGIAFYRPGAAWNESRSSNPLPLSVSEARERLEVIARREAEKSGQKIA